MELVGEYGFYVRLVVSIELVIRVVYRKVFFVLLVFVLYIVFEDYYDLREMVR